MKSRAAHRNIPTPTTVGNVFLPVPDTEFRDFLAQIDELVKYAPEILAAIERDLDEHGKKKKKMRLEDRRFARALSRELPGIQIDEYIVNDLELSLGIGRPRMPAYLVYVFVMIRGKLGSLTKQRDMTFIRESMSLYSFLQDRGYRMPAVITILENVNAVSNETRELIFNCQIRFVLEEELDDFKKLIVDSTKVEANSAWPTDARILTGLVQRAHRLGQKLEMFELPNFRTGWMKQWLKKMKSLKMKITLSAGKPHSTRKLKKYYRQLLTNGSKVIGHLEGELQRFEEEYRPFEYLLPSRRYMLERVLEQIRQDIVNAYRVIKDANERVFHGKVRSSRDKVLSLSDKTAAYIKKGGRDPVIGYKPQVGRSEQGFVTGLIVKEGNPADSAELVPLVWDVISRTGVVPEVVSGDDGYASETGRDDLLGGGVGVVSISGSRGKKLIGEEAWESEEYRDARAERSAIESLIFVLKHCFAFGRLSRRGLEAVQAEMLEKVLAYNSCRINYVRKKKRQKLKQAA